VRIAVVGTGRMGAFRADWLARHRDVERVLVASGDPARAHELATAVGGDAGSFDDALGWSSDAIVISSSTGEHARQIAAASTLGVPILSEKPVALTLAETRAALEAAERGGATLQVSFQRRFDPAFAEARRLVAEGALGTLYSVRLASHDHEPSPERYVPTSGGIFRDLHIHDFDIARWLTGIAVERVYATGAVRKWQRFGRHGDVDSTGIVLTMADGLPVLVSGTRHDPRGYDFRAEVFGSDDSVAIGLDRRTPLRSLEEGAPPLGVDPYRGFLERFAPAFDAELRAFLDVVRGRRENPCPGGEALEALRVSVACDRSLEERRPVDLAEVTDDP
jgi:myo-inositol 2-dehydrogenase/D-chiro-inositol 1-dehydrogenase